MLHYSALGGGDIPYPLSQVNDSFEEPLKNSGGFYSFLENSPSIDEIQSIQAFL